MWIPRIQDDSRLKYLGIADAIENDIKNHLLRPGDKLPSQRAIAEQLHVDLTTVTRALNEATKRGLVETQRGSGSFIAQTAFSLYSLSSLTEGKNIDLSMNNPPHPTSLNLHDEIVKGLAQIQCDGRSFDHLNYQETAGNPSDREAGALWLTQRIPDITSEKLLISSGAHSALFSILSYLKPTHNIIAAPVLTYPGLRAIADHLGFDVIAIAMDEEGIIPEYFEQCCQTKPPHILYLIPNIDNPTTATLPTVRRKQLVAIAEKYDVIIIEDDPYEPFQDTFLPSLYSLVPQRTWHIATLSKCVSPALRVAYVVAPDLEQALSLAEKMRVSNLMAPPLMTELASHWIGNGMLQKITHAIKLENIARHAIASAIFSKKTLISSVVGPHIWLILPANWRALEFAEHAHRSGISIVPSSAFVTGSNAMQAVRISLGGTIDSESLTDAFTVLAGLLQQKTIRTKAIV
ncbi:MAG: DNA-binding transcriptional MocR family regulator [Methylophagaceae bacterium]|jgi:DNA-binding transcriptional MocR family regulator